MSGPVPRSLLPPRVDLQLRSLERPRTSELRAQVRNFRARLVLDLNEVTLVDVAVVRFLTRGRLI